jgi:general nucleoside transport system ATP-binding protein
MEPAVEMLGITKYFESTRVRANDDVSFSVNKGEVHALVGENGAGKTTLMNILYGFIKPDAGTIRINGQQDEIGHPDDAIRLGIGMVHQHFKLVPSFTVAENIMLGAEPTNAAGFLRKTAEIEMVRSLGDKFGLPIEPTAKVGQLPVGMQQRVEILKSLERQAQILILDEPTAVLTPQEAQELFTVVRQLAASGRSVIFITHKLLEVMDVADRVSVMRKGVMVGSRNIGDTNIREMANMMVGREVLLRPNKSLKTPGKPVLEVQNLVVAAAGGIPAVMDVSFDVREGEIVGIAGVSGNGQTELVEAIAGMRRAELGKILLQGKDITHRTVRERRRIGLAHIPEDRIAVGLNLQTSLDENLVVTRYRNPLYNWLGLLRRGAMRDLSKSVIEQFSIRAARPGGSIAMLSGGNMQKVVLGRELGGEPSLIIANQPTRGLDVGSIEFVHQTLLEARERGAGILLISVELDEILALSDRILVLFSSRINGSMDADDATEEKLGILMAGGTLEEIPVTEAV